MSSPYLDFGRGLISGGLAMGRYAAGSMMASANMAAQAASFGVRTGAAAAGAVATAAGAVPGAALVRRVAEAVDREAAAAEEQAARRASESVERLGNGRSQWTELAADTAAAPLAGLAAAAAAAGVEAFKTAASTRPGRAALEGLLRGANGDAGAQRESLVVVASDTGAAAIRGGFSLAEAAIRLAFSDTRHLRRAMTDGLEQMRLLAAADEMHELLPVPAVDETVRARARRVVERTPRRFLAALGNPSPGVGEILGAVRDDADELRVFAAAYPRVAMLVVTRVGRLLISGELSFSEVEAFLEGRRLAVS